MNAEQLRKNVGQQVKLRPYVRQVQEVQLDLVDVAEINVMSSDGPRFRRPTSDTDYLWTIESLDDKNVTLHCSYTGHTVTLGADNVREYRTPGFLMLKCQLTLAPSEVQIEPI